MGVEVIKVCDYDRVIFNYFLFRPISRFFFGLHFLKVDIWLDIWSWAEQENDYISLSEGGLHLFLSAEHYISHLFDHKGLPKTHSDEYPHTPCAILQQRASNDNKKSGLTFN